MTEPVRRNAPIHPREESAPTVRIAQAGPDQWRTVADLRRDFVAEVRGVTVDDLPTGFGEANASYIESAMATDDYAALLAEDGDALVGGVAVMFNRMPPLPGDDRTLEAWLIAMWVAASHRRRGLGRSLLSRANELALERGARRMLLWATDDGLPLYRASGFSAPDTLMHQPLGLDGHP